MRSFSIYQTNKHSVELNDKIIIDIPRLHKNIDMAYN